MVEPPSPELIFETFNAYQRTAVLKAAVELDVFTAIGEGCTTSKSLADRCRATERGMRILCDYLVTIGFLSKTGGRYGHTPMSALFLDRHSPACLASTADFLTSPLLTDNFKDLAAVVRKGGTVLGAEGVVAPEHPVWASFARSMMPMMVPAAEAIATLVGARSGKNWKILDIAAGHGLFGITIARHNPNATVVALDWPHVLEVAEENARAMGVGERYELRPGSAFEVDFGGGYDLVLFTNFFHHFDQATCQELMRKSHRALQSGGRAVTLEFVPNEDRVSPPMPAAFAMVMLGATAGGDAYTFAEYQQMFASAGFLRNELHQLEQSPESVIISYKE